MQAKELEYVGFWSRVGASIIDSIIIVMIITPILIAVYGEASWSSEEFTKGYVDFFLSYIFPAVATIIFWVKIQATPGKIAISAKIVDAKTGNIPSVGQYIARYFAYFISILPLGLGFFWVVFDGRKQGFHDKLAGTIVVRAKDRSPKPVSFEEN